MDTGDEELCKRYLIAAATQEFQAIRHYIEVIGLSPDATYGGKPTALCYAVLKPCAALVDYYLSKGAAANYSDGMGMTPLHYAAMGGCLFCSARLISAGAKIDQRNRLGEAPLAHARSKDCAQLLRCYGATEPGVVSQRSSGDRALIEANPATAYFH